ncbi:MAG: enoyl-CoA hydratase/isomerase family protein [Chloroflexi bacterium]|nr:enoyl-CoA hydratase/isomerase family protein [Chloroflexota bacterium]MBV9596235.1 enoyl-CoA hydratase/isomerase family protein [Chloroflexota bacterium]
MATVTGAGYGQLILLEKQDGGIGIITFNRPEKRNAMSFAAQAEFRAALDDCREDCRVLILTGAGVAFSSGVDLSEGQNRQSRRNFAHGSNSWFETNEVLKEHPAVCIAAVNGYALGGGLTLVHNCDLAIASERAEFGMPEMSFNTFPGLAGPATIRRILPKHAAYMILTSRRIDAATAERWGIVNSVVPHDELMAEAQKLARHVAQFDASALDWAKKGYRDLDLMPWSEGLVYGGYIGSQIRRGDGSGGAGGGNPAVQRFLAGQPNPGQGANVLQKQQGS